MPIMNMNTLSPLTSIQEKLAVLAKQASSKPARLIAVSKTRNAAEIEALIKHGQRDFGENRVQEAQGKWPELLAQYPDIRVRLIGPLQTNKVKYLPNLFHAVDSVDRLSLAEALAHQAERSGYRPNVLVQVNTGEEPQKAGIPPHELEPFLKDCARLELDVQGLMCIPPQSEVAAIHFAFLKKLCNDYGLPECSMGMSGDYTTAAKLGATMVRVGTAVFGARVYETQE